jgi:ferredoxin
MAHIISDECLSCGACAETCPISAISEGDTKYVVDADACIDCGACEEACPVGAISAE